MDRLESSHDIGGKGRTVAMCNDKILVGRHDGRVKVIGLHEGVEEVVKVGQNLGMEFIM